MVEKWRKQLKKIQNKEILLIIEDIFKQNFNKYDFKKLSGYKNIYRIRKGKYRIVFSIDNNNIEIIRIQTRGDVYKSF